MNREFVRKIVRDLDAYDPEPQQANTVLNANENPYDLPEEIKSEITDRMKNVHFNRYPDPAATELIETFGETVGFEPDQIIAGSGLDEILSILTDTFIDEGDSVVSHAPGFSMYEIWTKLAGGEFIAVPDSVETIINVDGLITEALRNNAKIVFICSPNNPTGYKISLHDLQEILERTNSLVVLDEAYIDFDGNSYIDLVREYPNLIVLRTMSKAMRIPSLRCGFAIGSKELISAMKKVKSPYNLNALTQLIATIVLENKKLLEPAVEEIKEERKKLSDFLRSQKNIKVFPSTANFIYIKTNDHKKIEDKFLEKGILTRYYPKDKAFRITVGTPKENEQIIQAIQEVYNA